VNDLDLKDLINKHSSFTAHIKELIISLLLSYDIKFHIIESRTKSFESLKEKIQRKELKNLNEITDLSGLRIILYYQDDIDKVVELIKENFIIDEKNSVDKLSLYNSNEFGYLSVHYIVLLNKIRRNLPEWKKYSNLNAEIQIRTVLQHSWASISHELTYKKSYEIPKELQRKLFRLAGLFELADEQFLNIRDEHKAINESIKAISKTDEIETEDINLLTIKYSLEKTNTIYDKVIDLAVNNGFEVNNTVKDEYISEIIKASNILNLSKIDDLEKILENNLLNLKSYFKSLTNGTVWIGNKSFLILLALMYNFNKEQLIEFFKNNKNWHKDNEELVMNSVIKLKNL
jgi:ppGpp synthetase/RelA/SpoT-type nucleotidyltranferase